MARTRGRTAASTDSARPLQTSVAAALLLLAVSLMPGCRRERADRERIQVGTPSTIPTLDPHELTSVAVLSQLSSVYEALRTLDADLALRPGLAVS